MMKNLISISLLTVFAVTLIGAALFVQTEEADAIPAFARKYRMTCTTCHSPAPRLKAYGDDFAGNGFVLADEDAPRYYVPTGDENLDLIRDLPLAVRMEGYIRHNTAHGREAEFSYPYIFKLLSGGSLTDGIAYYFYFYISEHGEVAGVEDAYIMFNNLFGTELDIYLGQFQVSDPLFKRELRLGYEDYEIYKIQPGESRIDLTYDRGVMITYGFETGTDVILEVVNGNGIGEADDLKLFDDDKYKAGALRVTQDIGEKFRLGVFGYYGKERGVLGEGAADPDIVNHVNEVTMFGTDATFSFGNADLNIQYLHRKDKNPRFNPGDGPEVRMQGGLAEFIWLPQGDRSKLYFMGLYNFIEEEEVETIYNTITGHVGYMIRTNIRAFIENTYDIENEENRLILGIMAGI